jgi:hypothetical protein
MVGGESNRATMKAVPMTNCVPGRATVVSCVSDNNQSGNVGQKYSLPSRWLASHRALCFMDCPCRNFSKESNSMLCSSLASYAMQPSFTNHFLFSRELNKRNCIYNPARPFVDFVPPSYWHTFSIKRPRKLSNKTFLLEVQKTQLILPHNTYPQCFSVL